METVTQTTTTTEHTLSSHQVKKELELCTDRETQTHPLHRKLRLSAYINQKQEDARLVRSFREKFGQDVVLVMGNWLAPMYRFHESIRGKDMRDILRKHDIELYPLDEFRTSKLCPLCEFGNLSTFHVVPNTRPYQRVKMPKVVCHGLLHCNNEKCLKSITSDSSGSSPKLRLFNRDLAVVLNFRHILLSLREDIMIPEWFQRGYIVSQSTELKRPTKRQKAVVKNNT